MLKIVAVLVSGVGFMYGTQPFQAMTTFPTEVGTTSATLRGQVTSYGQATQCLFDVSSTGPGGSVTKTPSVYVPAVADVADVKQVVTGLPANATITATIECIPPGGTASVVGQAYSFSTGTPSGGGTTSTPTPTNAQNPSFNSSNIVTIGSPATPGVSPYAIVSIFGSGLATQTVTASGISLSDNLGGTSVSFNGMLGYVKYVSPNQVDVVVPPGMPTLATVTVQVNVDHGGGNIGTASGTVQSQMMTPSILGYQDLFGNNLATATPLHSTNGVWYLTLFGTGFGLANGVTAGQPASSTSLLLNPPSVTFSASDGRLTVQQVIWSGLAPGQVGIDQINVALTGPIAPGTGSLEIIAPDGHTIRVPINLAAQ